MLSELTAVGSEGSRNGQREKVGYKTVSTKTLAKDTGSCGAGWSGSILSQTGTRE